MRVALASCLVAAFGGSALADPPARSVVGLAEAGALFVLPSGDFDDDALGINASPGIAVNGGIRFRDNFDFLAGVRYFFVLDDVDDVDYTYWDLHVAFRPSLLLGGGLRGYALAELVWARIAADDFDDSAIGFGVGAGVLAKLGGGPLHLSAGFTYNSVSFEVEDSFFSVDIDGAWLGVMVALGGVF